MVATFPLKMISKNACVGLLIKFNEYLFKYS